jgi:hypothetical protein
MVVLLLPDFLISTIWQGGRAREALERKWDSLDCDFKFKSSALNLLFHGLDWETQDLHLVVAAPKKTEVLENAAENIAVRLVPTAQGLEFFWVVD